MPRKVTAWACEWCGKIKGENYTVIHERICRYNPANRHCCTCRRGTDSYPCCDMNRPDRINRDCPKWEPKNENE